MSYMKFTAGDILCVIKAHFTKICRVGLYTELFYAIIPTLFLCFWLIRYPYIMLHF